MARIWTEAGFVPDDPWIIETDVLKAGSNEKAILPLEEFLLRVRQDNETGFGVLLQPADDVEKLAPHLGRIAIVAIAFPAFNDGRGFSHAALLRERLGFEREIRAVGDVLIDPVPLMLRCGFDSFAVTNDVAIRRLSERRLPGISLHYQPAARDTRDARSYSWRRLAK